MEASSYWITLTVCSEAK